MAMLFATMSFGQKKKSPVTVAFGPTVTLPVGSAADGFDYGIGGLASISCKPTTKVTYSVKAGFISNQTKAGDALNQFPALLGVDYSFSKTFKLGGEAGVSFFNQSMGTWFSCGPVATIVCSNFDVALRYNTSLPNKPDTKDFSAVSLALSYKF